jgi:hypothetical protein
MSLPVLIQSSVRAALSKLLTCVLNFDRYRLILKTDLATGWTHNVSIEHENSVSFFNKLRKMPAPFQSSKRGWLTGIVFQFVEAASEGDLHTSLEDASLVDCRGDLAESR